jgi:hypothetical protein
MKKHFMHSMGLQPLATSLKAMGHKLGDALGSMPSPLNFKISIRVIRKVTLSLGLLSPYIPSFNGVSAK